MTFFKNLSRTARYMIYSLIGLFGFFLIAGLLAIKLVYPFDRPLYYFIGLFTGTLFSIIKLILMEKSVQKTVDLEAENAKTYSQGQFIIRYVLTIVYVVLIIVLNPRIGVIGAVIGILNLQVSAYIGNALLIRYEKKNPVKTDKTDDLSENDIKT